VAVREVSNLLDDAVLLIKNSFHPAFFNPM
jgi:hypothetical protein